MHSKYFTWIGILYEKKCKFALSIYKILEEYIPPSLFADHMFDIFATNSATASGGNMSAKHHRMLKFANYYFLYKGR